MAASQGEAPVHVASGDLDLRTERLGPLPILNHLLGRLEVDRLLDRFVPTKDRRCRLEWSKALGVLLRSIVVEREAIYRQHETVAAFADDAFGLTRDEIAVLGDDHIGRALDRLFDADRGALLTEIVVSAGKRFALRFDELHNDSTTIRFCGQYRRARGRKIRGKQAPFITYGFSKDHRPDLKQLLFILTTSRDGGVPIQFRCEAGNRTDSRTHEETWEILKTVAGTEKFLYVADSKLCSGEAMDYIDTRGGRFVTVLPRSRREDQRFREWLQKNEPAWETVRDRPHPRRRRGPRDIWRVFSEKLPSSEGWPVVWVFSSLLRARQIQSRDERLTLACQELQRLSAQLSGPKPRRRSRAQIELRIEQILRKTHCARYIVTDVEQVAEHKFRQERPGRPTSETLYRRKSKMRWEISWAINQAKVAYDRKSDGMYPLLTNDRSLAPKQVLEAHKRQPMIEKRFEQTKTVFEIAPVFLKNEDRIEALFFVYFLTMLVQGLLEREIRTAMKRVGLAALPLYPEERRTRRPTAEQILRLFAHVERHVLVQGGTDARAFEPKLTDLQRQVLGLLGIPEAYRIRQ
jgi:transposase